jgi:hypothetical protein
MASTTFTDNQSVIYASWLNDVNSTVYSGTFQASIITPSNIVCNGTVSGTGFTGLVNNTLGSPSAIGNVVPNTGAFTTLSTSGVASLNSLNLTTALTIANGGTGLTAVGATGNVLTSNGTTWTSSAPPAANGMTLLGTITTTSGTSVSLTGLTLTSYKQLQCVFNAVANSATANGVINLNSNSLNGTQTVNSTQTLYGYVNIDLTTGAFVPFVERFTKNPTGLINASGLTTSSTSITFTTSGSSSAFAGGSILVYGVK